MANQKQRWEIQDRVTAPPALSQWVGGHPLVVETLIRRGYDEIETIKGFLNPNAYTPAPATDFPGMTIAVERINAALENKEKICVWGDFDVDGQTSTTLLVSVLRDLGADVVYHIPVRATESHGMKVDYLAEVLKDDIQLILTCDTGIDAIEAVDFANEQGVDVIITDHHELSDHIPKAIVILNPHMLEAGHPLEALPGVGVAYKLAEALYAHVGTPERSAFLLDLVALGIVADVAVQVHDTRYLLQRGLVQLRRNKRLGLQVLMEVAQVKAETLSTTDIGFSIAPRMNALGRLGDANSIVELLTTQDLSRARILSSQLESLNSRRKLMTDEVTKAAVAQIDRDPSLLDFAALVLANPSWPPGVIGIVANRLSDRYQRPVVMLSSPSGEQARGSARSVYGCHITEAIATQSSLLDQYGGHAQAAGMSLPPENIDAFRRGLSRAVIQQFGGKVVEPPLSIDGFLSISELSSDLVDDLGRLSPFGRGNPALNLVLANVHLVSHRKIGRDGRHLRVTVEDDDNHSLDVLWWQWDDAPLPQKSESFDLALNVEINHYRGQRRMQAVWLSYRLTKQEDITMTTSPAQLDVIDYRSRGDKESVLEEILELTDAVIWREGPVTAFIPGNSRVELHPASILILWTPPPSSQVLGSVILKVSPKRVILVSDDSNTLDNTDAFLRYLTGLVKFAMRNEEKVNLASLAAAMGHNASTVRSGLEWLTARGFISVEDSEDDYIRFSTGNKGDQNKSGAILTELKTLLSETAAYRKYFSRMDLKQLAEMVNE